MYVFFNNFYSIGELSATVALYKLIFPTVGWDASD